MAYFANSLSDHVKPFLAVLRHSLLIHSVDKACTSFRLLLGQIRDQMGFTIWEVAADWHEPILQDYHQLNYSGSLSENYESSLRTGHGTLFLFRKSYQQMEPSGPRSC